MDDLEYKEITELGKDYLLQGRYYQAIELFNDLSANREGDYYPYYALGLAHLELKEYEKAIENLLASMQLSPTNLDIYSSLVSCYYYVDDYEFALLYTNKMLEIDSKSGEAHVWLGMLHFVKNEYEESLKSFEKAIEFGATEYVCYEKAGYLSLDTDPQKAKEYIQKSIEIEKNYFNLLILAKAHGYLDEFDEAMKYAKESLNIEKNIPAYQLIGDIFYVHQLYYDAIEYYQKVLFLDDTYPLYELARCYLAVGETTKAYGAFEMFTKYKQEPLSDEEKEFQKALMQTKDSRDRFVGILGL